MSARSKYLIVYRDACRAQRLLGVFTNTARPGSKSRPGTLHLPRRWSLSLGARTVPCDAPTDLINSLCRYRQAPSYHPISPQLPSQVQHTKSSTPSTTPLIYEYAYTPKRLSDPRPLQLSLQRTARMLIHVPCPIQTVLSFPICRTDARSGLLRHRHRGRRGKFVSARQLLLNVPLSSLLPCSFRVVQLDSWSWNCLRHD